MLISCQNNYSQLKIKILLTHQVISTFYNIAFECYVLKVPSSDLFVLMDKKNNSENNPSLQHDWSIHAHLKLIQRPNNDLPLSQQPCYGFRRGNIVFTAEPPQRQDSGLGSSSRESACDCTFNVIPQCEVCCGMRSPMSARRAQSFTAHFCTNVPPKKHMETVDVSSQTSPSTSMVFTKVFYLFVTDYSHYKFIFFHFRKIQNLF